jgi:gliding motility-associated-like protein
MVINGASTPVNDWCQTISVQANKYYRFSAWFKNIVTKPQYAGLPIANVELHINGQKISNNISLPDYPDVWVRLDTLWYSGSSTSVNLCIYDTSTSGNGNDFAIDDISFKLCNCPTLNPGIDRTICRGDSIQLHATSASVGTYLWSPNYFISDTTIASPKVKPPVTAKYYVTLTSNGCSVKDSVQINITNLHANAGPDVYSCKKDFIQLNGTGNAYSFTWSPIKYINSNIIFNPTVNPDTTISYILTVSNGTCIDRDTVTIFVTSIDANINNSDTSICLGDTVQFTTFINGDTYSWSPKISMNDTNSKTPFVFPKATTKYFLTVTRGTCVRKDSATINVVKNLVADAGSDQQICKGNIVQLSGTGPIGAVFSWLPNYALTDNTISNPIAKPLVDTSYFLKVHLGKNCIGYDTVKITVNSNPTVDAGLDKDICRESFITIGVSSTLADSFYWSPPNGLSNIKVLQTQASPTSNTTYFIKAINKITGCFNFDTVNVSLIKPTASFTSDVQSGQLPLDVHFTNSSINSKTYFWDFGDTTATSSQINPDHIFAKEGLRKVMLVAENKGCTDTAYTMIEVTGGLLIFIPNVVTVNSDGLNDEFVISYTKGALKKMHGSIWNRWGAKIYEWEIPGDKWWDGKVNGNFVQTDTYFYIIEATDFADKTQLFKGTVTLLR